MLELSRAILEYLKTSEHCKEVRDLIVGGDAGIIEAYNLDATGLDAQNATRRTDPEQSGKALYLTVQDAGCGQIIGHPVEEHVIFRIVDRGESADRISVLRQALLKVIYEIGSLETSDGIVELMSLSRSGILIDIRLGAQYEMIDAYYTRGGLLL